MLRGDFAQGISFTLIITRIGISEMVGDSDASDTYPTQSSDVQLGERGRTVNVFVARMADSQDADAHYDKTVPVCGESVDEARSWARAHRGVDVDMTRVRAV